MKQFVTFALSLSLLAMWILGCASAPKPMFWTKPGTSLDDVTNAKYMCLKESQQEVSHSKSDQYGGKSSSHAITNELLYESCMNAKGYYKSPVNNYADAQEQVVNPLKVNKTEQAKPAAEPAAETSKKHVENESKPSVAPQSTSSSSATMVVNESKAKLRKKPSAKSNVVKNLKKGEKVQLIKQQGEWFQVELASGDVGWCHKSVLTQTK